MALIFFLLYTYLFGDMFAKALQLTSETTEVEVLDVEAFTNFQKSECLQHMMAKAEMEAFKNYG